MSEVDRLDAMTRLEDCLPNQRPTTKVPASWRLSKPYSVPKPTRRSSNWF